VETASYPAYQSSMEHFRVPFKRQLFCIALWTVNILSELTWTIGGCMQPFLFMVIKLANLCMHGFFRTRVVLKKFGEVLDLVLPQTKVHNLIFG